MTTRWSSSTRGTSGVSKQVIDGTVRRELAEDLTARVVAPSSPVLGRRDTAEHLREQTSTKVLAVARELVERISALYVAKSIAIIEGEASAGKTARLASIRWKYQHHGHEMLVMTPTRKAAQVATREVGAASHIGPH